MTFSSEWQKYSASSGNGQCAEARWVKSSHSTSDGQCVESRRSTYSISNECVEIAFGVQVRDSKNPDGYVLSFTPRAWAAFLAKLT